MSVQVQTDVNLSHMTLKFCILSVFVTVVCTEFVDLFIPYKTSHSGFLEHSSEPSGSIKGRYYRVAAKLSVY
jgi:hypothetical protein